MSAVQGVNVAVDDVVDTIGKIRSVTNNGCCNIALTCNGNGVIFMYRPYCSKYMPVPDGWIPTSDYITYHCDQCQCPVYYKVSYGECQRNKNQQHDFCSYRCHNDYYIELRRQRLRLARRKVCQICDTEFQAARTDSKYCSHPGKQKAYRVRQAVAE